MLEEIKVRFESLILSTEKVIVIQAVCANPMVYPFYNFLFI